MIMSLMMDYMGLVSMVTCLITNIYRAVIKQIGQILSMSAISAKHYYFSVVILVLCVREVALAKLNDKIA